MIDKKLRVCVIFPQITNVSMLFLDQYIKLIKPLCKSLILITNDNVLEIRENLTISQSTSSPFPQRLSFLKILHLINLEMSISLKLLSVYPKVDIIILNITRGTLLLPEIIARILGKKLIVITGGTISECLRNVSYNYIFIRLAVLTTILLENIIYIFADRIVIFSDLELHKKIGLKFHKRKLVSDGARYVDINNFNQERELDLRSKKIGFIGRFAEEKGIQNFLKSIEIISKINDNDIKYLIIGGGPLAPIVEQAASRYPNTIELIGFASHQDISIYLNDLKLLVIPSYTEGLPNIMLEAMACGTPVLATPVGAIPDILIDGETGFIMDDNSPECIARHILKCLNNPHLDLIAENAKNLIKENYTYQSAEIRYRRIFENLF